MILLAGGQLFPWGNLEGRGLVPIEGVVELIDGVLLRHETLPGEMGKMY